MAYSNSEVAHRFASGIGDHCTGSHMFFEGNIIYSYGYHFPMAIKWNGMILYNDQTYSVSTAKHQGYVLGACSHFDIVHCATLELWDKWDNKKTNGFVKKNPEQWDYEIDRLVKKMATARKPEKWLAEILRVVEKVERFCSVFEEKVPQKMYRFKDEKAVAKAKEFALHEMKLERERERRRQAKEIKDFHEFKKSWVNLDFQIVRYREDKNRFETSKGVEIPFEIGKRFYERLRDGELRVGDKVLYYTVSHVGDTIKIGCHTFKKSYLLDYGKKMFNE